MHTPSQAVVIGGGISGLSCAYGLRQLGIPVLLLEQASRVGGVIESVEQDGFLFELGPQSFSPTDTLLEIIAALGLSDALLRADPRATRYILKSKRLQPVPMSPPALLTTSLLSASAKWRLLTEAFRRTRPPAEDESVADFVRRKFGVELLETLVAPFVSGVYAGDPEKLSLRSAFPTAHQWELKFGSVIRGAMKSRAPKQKPRPSLCSFRDGMAALCRALGQHMGDALRCGVSATSISRSKADGKSSFELRVSHHGRAEVLTAQAVIVATDPHSAGRLLASVSPRFGSTLAQIGFAPVAVVAAGYPREQIGHPANGLGFLVPRSEGLRLLGSVWNSSLFPGRAPEGTVCFTCFAGGATDPELCLLSEDQIADIVTGELAGVLKINGPPVTRLVRRYPRALPQYNLGHGKIMAAFSDLVASVPGLFLTGNYLEGPSIGACVEQGFRAAHAVRRYLTSTDEASREATV